MDRLFLKFIFVVYFVLIIFSCSSTSSKNKDIGKLLYNSGCNKCHDNSIVCLNLGKDNAYWKKTVYRMAKKVKTNTVDKRLLIDTLSSLKKGKNDLCD